MTFNQILIFLDKNLDPSKGGKVQITIDEDTKNEKIKAFIFDKNINSYSYIMCFAKTKIDNVDTFRSYVISGFSGLEYKLGLEVNQELYDGIKQSCLAADSAYMKEFQTAVSAIVVEKKEEKTPAVDVE